MLHVFALNNTECLSYSFDTRRMPCRDSTDATFCSPSTKFPPKISTQTHENKQLRSDSEKTVLRVTRLFSPVALFFTSCKYINKYSSRAKVTLIGRVKSDEQFGI